MVDGIIFTLKMDLSGSMCFDNEEDEGGLSTPNNDGMLHTEDCYAENSLTSVNGYYRPIVGKTFNSYEEAKSMYYKHALRLGFFVPRGTTKVVDGMMTLRSFVCYR